jgi:hypothetical protein
MSSQKPDVIFLNTWNFFAGLRLVNGSHNLGTKFYVYDHIIAALVSLNWSGPRQRGITTATSVKKWVCDGSCNNYLGGIIAAGLFSLFIGYKAKACSAT